MIFADGAGATIISASESDKGGYLAQCSRTDANYSRSRIGTKFCSLESVNHIGHTERTHENAFDEYHQSVGGQ